jgi:parvulin-like peptidyl-prolyl isomerase
VIAVPTRRPALRLSAVALLALVTAACGTSSATVATVNGEPIERSDVVSLRNSYEDAASTDGEMFRQDLTGLIIQQAMVDAARDQFDVEISDAAVTERATDPPTRYASIFESIAADPDAGPGLVEANAVRSLISDAVVGEMALEASGGAEQLLAASPQDVTLVCARHILTQTAEEAEEVLERLEAGEAFSELVTEVSLDTNSPGGLLAGPEGCPVHLTPLGVDFAVAAATAPIGEPTGPVATEFGYHVIVVDERVSPTVEQLEDDLAAYFDPNVGAEFFTSWFNEVVRSADIDVASAAGTWSPTAVAIVPPGGSETPAPGDLPGEEGVPGEEGAPADTVPDS